MIYYGIRNCGCLRTNLQGLWQSTCFRIERNYLVAVEREYDVRAPREVLVLYIDGIDGEFDTLVLQATYVTPRV